MQMHDQHQDQSSAADGKAVTVGTDESAYFVYRGKDDNIHGPYGASQMKGWVQQVSTQPGLSLGVAGQRVERVA